MSAERVAAQAARLAAAAAWLREPEWRDDAARLAGGEPPEGAPEAPPTFGEVARWGTAVVVGARAARGAGTRRRRRRAT